MKVDDIIEVLSKEMESELQQNILPFWMNRMVDIDTGGFYGRISGKDKLYPDAEKGAVLNARILWTFAAAYRLLGKKEYLEIATRAKDYLINFFYDKTYGGVFWSVDCRGNCVDSKKQIYALGFAIYGLSEYYRATTDKESLEYAITLFDTLEKYSFDSIQNGYFEAFGRDWDEISDMRLSDKDKNERKTMNTHLHVLEAYTNLYRVWKDSRLKNKLRNLVEIFLTKILNEKTGHLNLFFNDSWVNKYSIVSYGHDIEASWLIHEAALLLNDEILLRKTEPVVEFIAAAADEGLNADGSMNYEMHLDAKNSDTERHWWVQAESVVGHFNLYQYFGDEIALKKAFGSWSYIKEHLIDKEHGEWHWSISAEGKVNFKDDKAGLWKCPYHNGRMCIEIIERCGVLREVRV